MSSLGNGRKEMEILYNDRTDLLYIRLDNRKQQVMNKRISEDIVLDIEDNDKIVGIEVLDASKHLDLEKLVPVTYRVSSQAVS
jgi:uncharacterized protein YuzE